MSASDPPRSSDAPDPDSDAALAAARERIREVDLKLVALAAERVRRAREIGEIKRRAGHATPVVAISTAEYPTPARRPRNSRLDCSRLRRDCGVALPTWEEQLAEVTLAAP